MSVDPILRTTSRGPRPGGMTLPAPPPDEPSPEHQPRPRGPLLLLLGVAALTALWLVAIAGAVGPDSTTLPWGALAVGYATCLAIVFAPIIAPQRARGPTLLLGLGTAAIVPLMAIGAELLGWLQAPSSAVLAFTLAAVVAACASLFVWRAPPPIAPPPDESRVGRYRLVRELGVGGMGEVWRAEHDTLARPAALKLIRRHRLDNPTLEREMLERFRMEAEVTARLTSPHTVVLYDYGVTDTGALYYAMELLDGMSLKALVQRYGPQPEARVIWFLRHACHSLVEAHDAGLVHRDLKPENLFIAKLGRDEDVLKVLDFGLVKELASAPIDLRDRRTRVRVTVSGARPGTPGFMAPEQIAGDAPIDQRADVYALGCVAYHALTATPVFTGQVE